MITISYQIKNNAKEVHKIYSNKYIVYNQKSNILIPNSLSSQNISNRNKDKKKIDFIYKKNENAKFYEELKKQRKIIKNKILNLIGEDDYKKIIQLYEKTYVEEDKAQEYFEYIENYVNSKFDAIKKEKFENYLDQLMSIDCHLYIKN